MNFINFTANKNVSNLQNITSRMKTTNKKIIFLDFDGVMDTGYQEATKSLVSDKYGHIFDNECVVNLKKIIDYTKAGE